MLELSTIGAVVLSAGKGSRLKSTDTPKVMRQIGGKPIVSYTVETLKKMGLGSQQICLVVGFCKEKVIEHFGETVVYAEQIELKGTAHAAFTGMTVLPKEIKHVIVMGGDDSAFYTPETLKKLIRHHLVSKAVVTLLTVEPKNFQSLGRIIRQQNGAIEIIEKELLTDEQKLIRECSTGTFVFERDWFEKIFPTLPVMPVLKEYGLPTTLEMARTQGEKCEVVKMENYDEWFGINTLEELDEADRRKKGV